MLLFVYPNALTLILVPWALLALLFSTKRMSRGRAIGWSISWFIIAGLITAFQPVTASRRLPLCPGNFKFSGLALQNYCSTNREFPASFVADGKGNPMLSWRTTILPDIELQSTFDKVDFDKPWNHPVNLTLAQPTPKYFQCPDRTNRWRTDDSTTDFIGVVGDRLVWRSDGTGTKPSSITDGCSNTILLMELSNHRVPWMSPNDMRYEEFLKLLRTSKKELLTSHADGCQVLFCDGSVRYIRSDVSDKALLSGLTIGDGGPIPDLQ